MQEDEVKEKTAVFTNMTKLQKVFKSSKEVGIA